MKDSWSDIEPHVPYIPPYDEMTREEIDAMIDREAGYLEEWERIWGRSSNRRKKRIKRFSKVRGKK